MSIHLLAFGAHPDDIEFGCGGVLIKEVQAGHKVTMIDCSRGEAGSAGSAEQREEEARCAASTFGAEVQFLDFGGDSHITESISNRMVISRKIREIKPDIVLAPTPDQNQHPDHLAISHLVRDGSRLARYGGLAELKDLEPHAIRSLYYYAVTRFPTELPDVVIDISEVYDLWVKAMKCHQSQVQNKSYLELQEARTRFLGLSSGVRYAIGLWASDPIALERLSDLPASSRNF